MSLRFTDAIQKWTPRCYAARSAAGNASPRRASAGRHRLVCACRFPTRWRLIAETLSSTANSVCVKPRSRRMARICFAGIGLTGGGSSSCARAPGAARQPEMNHASQISIQKRGRFEHNTRRGEGRLRLRQVACTALSSATRRAHSMQRSS